MNMTFDSQPATAVTRTRRPFRISADTLSMWKRIPLFLALLICSLAVYMFGPDYYPLFITNGNTLYAAILTGVFLISALSFKRSERLKQYWGITYALFVASAVNLICDLFAGYNTQFVELFGITSDPNRTDALAKIYGTLLVVIPILVLTLVSGADLKSLYLKIGNQHRWWGLGIGALILFNFFTSVLIFFGTGYTPVKLGSAVLWGLVFSFSNSILEELWIRGLVMKKLLPLLGAGGTVLLTSIAFASAHYLSVAYFPPTVVPIFVVNTFTLGLACGILMLKTDSIWGAYLIHAAADVFLFIATLAAR